MLERLFTSKTRLKLLKLFLLHPESAYSLNELVRDLKLQQEAAKREVESLEKFGLLLPVSSIEDGEAVRSISNGRKWQVDENFILFEELKALIIKAQILYERDFVDKILKIGKIKLFILSGMFVNNPESPIDMLIVGRLNKPKLYRYIKELERDMGKEVNFTTMEPTEFIYRRNITDVFLYQILEGRKIVILDDLNS